MSNSGGGVSFTGPYGDMYNVSYTAPTFTPPSGATLYSVNVTSAGPSQVGCGGVSASQTWQATYRFDANVYTYESATRSGTSGACNPPPTYPPSWIDNTLAGFQADVAYSDGVSVSNTGYSGTYSISSGALPSGLSLSLTGSSYSLVATISGTPTTAGQSYSFTITASNSYGSVSQAFSGTVAASPTAGKLRVWTGTTWVVAPAKVWNGTGWVAGTVKVWNGTAWVTSV